MEPVRITAVWLSGYKKYMKDLFKYVIAVGIIIISLSIGYFFLKVLPAIETKKIDLQKSSIVLERQKDCALAGKEYYEQINKDKLEGELIFAFAYRYNEELNTCLFRGGSLSGSIGHYYIDDIYTNKSIAYYLWNSETSMIIEGDKEYFEEMIVKYGFDN